MAQNERRKTERVKGDIAISVNDQDSNLITEAKDISEAGVCCRTNKEMPLMDQVVVTLLLPQTTKGKKTTKKIKCTGVVVRLEPIKNEPDHFETAIFFTEMGKADKKALVKYVEYLKSKES